MRSISDLRPWRLWRVVPLMLALAVAGCATDSSRSPAVLPPPAPPPPVAAEAPTEPEEASESVYPDPPASPIDTDGPYRDGVVGSDRVVMGDDDPPPTREPAEPQFSQAPVGAAPPARAADDATADDATDLIGDGALDSVTDPAGDGSVDREPVVADDPLREVDEALAQLVAGGVAFNTPGDMGLGDVRYVELVVSATETGDDLRGQVREEGAVVDTVAQVSKDLRANLESLTSGLLVTAVGSDRQMLGRSRPARWRWRVEAVEGGSHDLSLILFATVLVGEEAHETEVQTFKRAIRVRVSVTQRAAAFLGENWQWVASVIVLPLIGWGWRSRRQAGRAPGDA